ncbi:MAG: NAD-dependent epimerase/dehydratase family protein [Nocardioidaceae bacterium]
MTELLEAPELTILTGASGWFGRAYLAALASGMDSDRVGPVRRGGRVRVLVPTPSDVPAVSEVSPHAEVHVGDVAEGGAVARLFAGAEGASVVHAAGVIHPKRVADFERVNTGGTITVLDAARAARVRRMVHVSSNSPFGVNPTTEDVFRHDEPYRPYMGYGRSKMLAEQRVRDANDPGGLQTVVVRPPWFYGPWQPLRQTTFFRLVRTGRFPLMGDGRQRRSMVFVDNLVQGVALAERHPDAAGDAFWIADARAYPMSEVLATVKRALADEGFEVADRQIRLPAVAGKIAERIDGVLQARGIYHQEFHVLGEMDKTIACDIGHSQQVLGYAPRVDLHAGMRESIRWCVERGVDI